MKQMIRYSTFETNSSSTHSCVICTEEENKKWESGECFYSDDYKGSKFVTAEEVKAEFNKEFPEEFDEDRFEEWCLDNDYYTIDTWGGEDYEYDTTSREINGMKIYVHCYYGFD